MPNKHTGVRPEQPLRNILRQHKHSKQKQQNDMGKVLMIGAGGVATVAAFKIAQNKTHFGEFMIASRRKEKCDEIVDAIHAKGNDMDIKTAQVDADDVE